MAFCERLGRGLVREPYLSTVITCGAFLRHGGSAKQQADYIPGIIDGSKQWAFRGMPLYYFIKDTKPGDKMGQGMGGVWNVAKP